MEAKNFIYIDHYKHIRYQQNHLSDKEILYQSTSFFNFMDKRRSVREFSSEPIAKKVIENIVKTASTAPSGAHKQPWTFCIVSNANIKSKIRAAAEKEEQESYQNRMNDNWLKDLTPLGTNANKPFLEDAPYLIVVFKKVFEYGKKGNKQNNYYVNESVGLACGILISAIHNAGLVTLTHTPSPMKFLSKILNRPNNERPFLLLPVGLPKELVYVPDIQRKDLNKVSEFYE